MPGMLLLAFLTIVIGSSVAQESVPAFTVDVGLVNLSVAVTAKNGRSYSKLKASNFRIYDNGIEQEIKYFNHYDAPYSMGLVLDRSGSMVEMIGDVYDAAFHTIQYSKDNDEFFIELFNDQIEMRQELTIDRNLLRNRLEGVYAYESTALYDAILAALDNIRKGRYEKKALLVVTDGADNSSKHRFQEVLDVLVLTVL